MELRILKPFKFDFSAFFLDFFCFFFGFLAFFGLVSLPSLLRRFCPFFSGGVCNFFAALTCAGYLSILSFAVGFHKRFGVVHTRASQVICNLGVVAVPLIWRFVHTPHFSCSAMNPVFFGAFCCFFIVSVDPLQSFARRRTIENTLYFAFRGWCFSFLDFSSISSAVFCKIYNRILPFVFNTGRQASSFI